MGFLFKLILVFILLGFLARQIGKYIFRRVLKNFYDALQEQQSQFQHRAESQQTYRRAKGVNIDFIPEDEIKKRRKSRDFKDGDYIDYEEIKD